MKMVNVIGLGYIGLPTALMMASHGVEVIGTDYNKELVATLNAGRTTFKEDGLDELFQDALRSGIKFTTEYQVTDTYIVSVPTPISDWGDPFDGDPGKKIAPYFTSIQKRICNTFDYVVTPTENAVSYYQKYKKDNNGIKVIPQGFDFSEIEVFDYIPNDVPHFAYAGIFYKDKRNPAEFLEFLTQVKSDFVFTIYTVKHGPMYQEILAKYKEKLKDKLIIEDMIPRVECIKQLSKNDFLINIDNLDSVQVPSKLIDYTLAGRPIINFRQNEIPTEKFYQFLTSDYSGQYTIAIEDYDIKNVAAKFDGLICGV